MMRLEKWREKISDGEIVKVSWSYNGKYAVAGYFEGKIVLYDFYRDTFYETKVDIDYLSTVGLSPNGEYIVLLGNAKIIIVGRNGEILYKRWLLCDDRENCDFPSLSLSPDGKNMIVGSSEYHLFLLDNRGKIIYEIDSMHSGIISSIVYRGDGKLFATGDSNGLVSIYDSGEYSILNKIKCDGRISDIAWSFDGKYIAISAKNKIIVYNSNYKYFRKLVAGNFIDCISWSPDNRYIISSGEDGCLTIWNIEQMKVVNKICAHERPVLSISTSPNKKYLVSGGLDGKMIIWSYR